MPFSTAITRGFSLFFSILFLKPISSVWLLAGCCCFSTLAATTQPTTIRVLTEYLAPFQIKNADGNLGGYSTDIVKRLFAITGDTAKMEILPWSRSYRIAQQQPNVLIYSMARTHNRETLFHWVGSVKYERMYVWGLKSRFSQPFCTIQEFQDLIFASSKNYNTDIFLQQHHFKTVQKVGLNEQIIGMLFRKRADLIVGNELVFKHQAELLNLDFAQMRKLYAAQSLNANLSIAFSLTTEPAILQRFDQAFKQLQSSGELAKIKQKWQIKDDDTQEEQSPAEAFGRQCL